MRTRLLVTLVALSGSMLVVASPAASAADQSSGSYRFAAITFNKNYRNVFRSNLTWNVYKVTNGHRTRVLHKEWRAGSGYTKHSTNSCRRNNGWLPNGRYHPRLYADYDGSKIKGRAIYLGRHACHNGTVRQQLFIHTEQGAGSRQCPNRKGDQLCRWEYPAYNEYRSLGCIKLSPGDLEQLYDAWRSFTKSRYTSRVRVLVS
jgi:hypothetical protein